MTTDTNKAELAPASDTALTTAQATRVIIDGVNRENRRGNEQVLALVRDAIKLQGHNIRKLAVLAENEGKLSVGFDSYLSYMSNANGIAAMFEYDLDAFQAWLDKCGMVGLSAIYKHFREAFGPEKPAKPNNKSDKDKDEVTSTETLNGTPLEVVLSLLPHLTPEERVQVIEAAFAIDNMELEEDELLEAA